MPGQARAKSVGSKNRSRAWSIRRIDVHYRSVAGRFSATSHRRQVRSALNPHCSSGPWRKWWDGAPSVARWDCLPMAPMLGSRMAEPARSQVVCRTSIAPRADCQCAHSNAGPLMGAACGGTTVSYAVTRSVRRMSPEGRSPALSNDRCAASNAAAMLRRDSSELTGRSRCRTAFHQARTAPG